MIKKIEKPFNEEEKTSPTVNTQESCETSFLLLIDLLRKITVLTTFLGVNINPQYFRKK
jgi:hypothetical protein